MTEPLVRYFRRILPGKIKDPGNGAAEPLTLQQNINGDIIFLSYAWRHTFSLFWICIFLLFFQDSPPFPFFPQHPQNMYLIFRLFHHIKDNRRWKRLLKNGVRAVINMGIAKEASQSKPHYALAFLLLDLNSVIFWKASSIGSSLPASISSMPRSSILIRFSFPCIASFTLLSIAASITFTSHLFPDSNSISTQSHLTT